MTSDLVKLIKDVSNKITSLQHNLNYVRYCESITHLEAAEKKATGSNPIYSLVKYRLEKVLEMVLVDLHGEIVVLLSLEKAIELAKQGRDTFNEGEWKFYSDPEPLSSKAAELPALSKRGKDMTDFFGLMERIKLSLATKDNNLSALTKLDLQESIISARNIEYAIQQTEKNFLSQSQTEKVRLPKELVFSELNLALSPYDFVIKVKFAYVGEYGIGFVWKLYRYDDGKVEPTHPTINNRSWFVEDEWFCDIVDALTALCRRYGLPTRISPVINAVLEGVREKSGWGEKELLSAYENFGPGRTELALKYLHREELIRNGVFNLICLTDKGKTTLFDANNLF